MALAAGPRGAVFALELVPALHHHNVVNALANRNLSRLIPVNVAVRGPGAGKLRSARTVRVWRWFKEAMPHLQKHVSFVKIDVDALSASTAAQLLEDLAAADERPVIKAEWFAGDRKRGCTSEMERLFEKAGTVGYGVYAADATTRFEELRAQKHWRLRRRTTARRSRAGAVASTRISTSSPPRDAARRSCREAPRSRPSPSAGATSRHRRDAR